MHSKGRESGIPARSFAMPKTIAGTGPTRIDDSNEDFIPHPAQFPLRYHRRRSLMPRFLRRDEPTTGDVGLSFHTREYIPAGAELELEIPLRGRVQRFCATVVLVRECAEDFEIGLWFTSRSDAERARLVEKICRVECTLQAQRRPDA